MLRTATAVLVLSLSAFAQSPEASSALERFAKLRPGNDDLAMYRLDWAESLAAAEKKAAAEKRPILLVVIHAKYGDMITGHC
ncbi:MAG: hypothetical protein IT452_19870 [Planctomycetia bacterium]|nr:hypothetical protein [Planctomycetia bacterium]